MKISSLFFWLLFCGAVTASETFSSGGVAVDWSKYDPKAQPVQKSSVNYVLNGSFEEPVDFNAPRSKRVWNSGSRTHGMKKTPEVKVFQERFAKSIIRQVRSSGAADGKSFLFIKTPDAVKDWYKPFPQISNRLLQTVKIPVQKSQRTC